MDKNLLEIRENDLVELYFRIEAVKQQEGTKSKVKNFLNQSKNPKNSQRTYSDPEKSHSIKKGVVCCPSESEKKLGADFTVVDKEKARHLVALEFPSRYYTLTPCSSVTPVQLLPFDLDVETLEI